MDRDGVNDALKRAAEENIMPAMTAIERQYAPQPGIERRIHIVGTGSIGKLVAHALRGIPNPPPITLIFHRYKLMKAWEESRKVITVQDGEYTVERGGFEAELAPEMRRFHGVDLELGGPDIEQLSSETGLRPDEVAKIIAEQKKEAELQRKEEDIKKSSSAYTPFDGEGQDSEEAQRNGLPGDRYVSTEPIHNLILTTKTVHTITALSRIKHRLSRESTICFLQNGMGVIDDINKEIFPDEATRPNYVQGIVSHGANVPPEKAEQDPFFVVHAGRGTIFLGAIPRKPLAEQVKERPPTPTGYGTDNAGHISPRAVEQWSPSARYILRTITRTPVLAAVGYTPIELLQLQLEKLAINSVLNPLTSLIDQRNGALTYDFSLTRTMRLLLAETSLVIRSLPELRGIPNVPNRFSSQRLETLVVSVSDKTRDNISSMLADVRAGRRTEIDYINGYIVRRGEDLGISCVVNYALMQIVKGKARMVTRENHDEVPLDRSLIHE